MRRLLILCLLLPTLAAAASVEVLPLHNRPAEEIIPLLLPLLSPEDAISGQGGTLIVRTSPTTLQAIQRLLGELDRAPRNLIISVRSSMDNIREGTSAGGRIQVGPGGTTIQGSAGTRELSTGRGAIQQIRVLEGMPAMLRVGEESLRTEPAIVPYPGGYAVVPTTTTRATGRWLRVVPHLQGQQVLLDIQPEEAHPDPSHPRTLNVQRLATQVMVPLGQWVSLGGLDSQEQRNNSGWSISTRSQSSQVWVKVELADGTP
ncbi:MAG: hypothetical protein P3W87_000275 [Gammaproteobacteria bacterium]|nr:hypothetical protein [Gammaproteobacteria bacterium]